MDQNSKIIDDFESLLKNHSSKKPPGLYIEHKNKTLNTSKTGKLCSAKEVLANVAKQVKAIQNADTASYKRVGRKLDKYKKREFLTVVDMIPVFTEVPQNIPTKFETQCVTDTQLINVIENAEIIDRHRGVTQEFDKTFGQKNGKDESDDKLNDGSLKPNAITDVVIDRRKNISVDRKEHNPNDHNSKLFEISDLITCEMDTITCYQNDMVSDIDDEVNLNKSQDVEGNKCAIILDEAMVEANRSISPILTTYRNNSTPPLVVNLYTFENFENLAHPIIEQHEDLEIAKNVINSQIIGREICIPDRIYDNIGCESPVLGKIECITTNINKDELESICTCSKKCIDKDVINTDDLINGDTSCSKTGNIIFENKKRESNIIKTEIKDEILFSSDEEYEYLHKEVQELPLTCALETSFYDTSDVLDKTMYVAFQTASNKSIQIQSDSFYKAKSFLSSIDNEGSETTLSDLVKILDSGKDAGEHVQSTNCNSGNPNYNAENKESSRIDHYNDTNVPPTSENPLELEQKIDDTFQNICLTELEQDGDVIDDIVMSQIIEFKSISRSTKANIITPIEKISDTFDDVALMALEQNKQMDDDVPMSQIIECKSTARTPKYVENVCNTSISDVFAHPAEVITKRKFEGFKTASNKKIRLSDKALARCKKVFQDIDLNDTIDIDCNSGINKDSKLRAPNVSYDRSEIDHCTKDTGNDIGDYPSRLSHLAAKIAGEINAHQNQTDLNMKEKQPKMEDVDLQINDQVLQEFENNEMSFEETNNNACIGFKTANNKNIAISDIAMMKCKHLTINGDNDSDSIAKTTKKYSDDSEKHQNVLKKTAVNITEMSDKQIKSSKEALAKVKSNIHNIKKREENNREYDNNKSSTSDFIGFKTAANKEINISEQAKTITKDFFKCLDKEFLVDTDGEKSNTNMENKNTNHVESEFNCGIDTQDFFGDELTLIEDFFKDNVMDNEIPANPIFKGFQTASKKTIIISEKALEKSKKLFEDITDKECDTKFQIKDIKSKEEYDNQDKTESLKSNSTNVDYKNHCVKTQFKGFAVNEESFEPNKIKNETQIFEGFQTASNKKVNISDKALKTTKKLFQDIVIFNSKETTQNEETELDIHVAYNKVHISEIKSKHRAKTIDDIKIAETSKNYLPKVEKPVFCGFQTANEPVEVSEIDLARSKKLTDESNIKAPIYVGFKTASAKPIHISVDAVERTKGILREFELDEGIIMDTNFKQPLSPKPSTNKVGFQTASNKELNISNDALAASKKIFQDIDIFEKECEIASEKRDQEEKSSQFNGFQTACNKKVSVSKKALEKSRKLFHDINTNDLTDQRNESTPLFRGFQTASNKQVKISNEALARSKQLFSDVDIFDKNEKDSEIVEKDNQANQFKGFKTANSKQVRMSEKALERSRNLLNYINTNDLKDEKHEGAPVLQGFQTASNEKVKISDKALAKSKKSFEDINLSQLDRDPKPTLFTNIEVNNAVNENKSKPLVAEGNSQGSQAGSYKTFKLSEQTLAKSIDLLKNKDKEKGLNNNIRINTSETRAPEVKVINNRNVASRNSNKMNIGPIESKIDDSHIDTQVLNDFQDTLNTEDFSKSTPKSKRSGSPILSCPRAKKRKFETPYRSHKKIEPTNVFVPPKLAKTYSFDNEYKKHKKYSLEDIENLEKELSKNKTVIGTYISEFKFDSLLNFEFFNVRNDYTKAKINVEELKKIFLDSVNKKIVPDGWLDNHIKLIIWKLLSYEIKYPNVMENTCTVRNVLEQLKYRYDRELYHVQRPILRKVLEKDEVPSKTMVLCVAGIYVDNISVTSVISSSQNVELLLTDGWYCVRTCTDRMLYRLLAKGAIVVGAKISVCGAELMNCEQGVAPWEDTSSVRLKLSGNSVRLCRWSARLGLRPGLVQCPLGAVRADGGRVAAARVLVARVYPPLYVERMDDGSTVTLSERLENIRQMKHESEREAVMEKLYEEMEKEMSDQESHDSEGCSIERGCLDSGSQISKCVSSSKDPDECRSHLTKSQNRMLEEHNSRQREKLIERVRAKFQQKLEKNGLITDRNVVPLLKVRVAGFAEKDTVEVTKGYLSIWKPSAAVLELVTEGAWIEILNVIPTGMRNTEIQLSAGRQTVFNSYKQTNDKFNLYAKTLGRKCYEIKEITQNPGLTTDYNEIDIVGMIFCVEPSTKEFDEKQNFQNVYIADADKNIVCVNFWGGLRKYGFENILDTGQIITCVNLQKRAGNTRKSIPQYRVTEFSYFTKTPKYKKALELTNELSNKLSKIKDKFCQDCMLLKNNYSVFKTRNNENVSPYRFDYNVSKNMESPLRKCDANLNLTGLDFDSSFDTQDISPQALLRKKKVNERIEKIRLNYGEPPPLASIHIINQSKNASATYKSPLISNLERSKNVASAETPSLQNVSSPVSMNTTYVKNVNPVKLNFSSASNLNDSDFAEDFEASPPLSLDSDTVN